MHLRKLHPAFAVPAFVVGAATDSDLRAPGNAPGCDRTSAGCLVLTIADHTSLLPKQTAETLKWPASTRRVG
jgi:hypothetical protein